MKRVDKSIKRTFIMKRKNLLRLLIEILEYVFNKILLSIDFIKLSKIFRKKKSRGS